MNIRILVATVTNASKYGTYYALDAVYVLGTTSHLGAYIHTREKACTRTSMSYSPQERCRASRPRWSVCVVPQATTRKTKPLLYDLKLSVLVSG